MSAVRRGLPSAMSVPAPADRRFRRPDVRPGRQRKAGATLSRIGMLAVALVVLVASGAWVSNAFVHSSFFTVSRLVIRGNGQVSAGEIEVLVDGIRRESILLVDFERYRKRLMDSPWIAGVTLSRELPSTVSIRVTERVPIALARQEELLYLVDEVGNIIDEFGPQYRRFDLPVVDGLFSHSGARAADAGRVQLAAELIAAVETAPELRTRLSQVDVSDEHDAVVLLDGDPVLLHVGDRQFVERLRRYLELAPALKTRMGPLEWADLRFDDQMPVREQRKAATKTNVKDKGR